VGIKKAVACIKKYNNFLITAHTNLEGDALGSELAFCGLLKKMGKRAVIINEDDLPYGYDFLPGTKNIKKFKNNLKKQVRFDCFAALDCSDLGRTGEVYRLNADKKPVLNIDHHIGNQRFGDVNWVEPQASSCSEMIYKLYKKIRIPLDRDAAVLLYVGILTDTGSFRYSNTTSFTHKAVSELLKHVFDIPQIYKNIYENIPFSDMKLLSKILPQIRCCASGKIAWLQIERGILKDKKSSFDLTEHILGFARAIKDVEVVALFKENLGAKGKIRVNLRSQGNADVNRIASFFGGGGHRTASGATVSGRIDDVRRKVLAKIRQSLK
jgi:phosphoesterase RecJ-like protein